MVFTWIQGDVEIAKEDLAITQISVELFELDTDVLSSNWVL